MLPAPLADIICLARAAGAIAMAHRGKCKASFKADGSPVTAADFETSALIVAELRRLSPEIAIIAEEFTRHDNLMVMREGASYWAVDGLDGTASYLEGYDGFSVNIGYVREGFPAAGVMFFPAKQELFYTGPDGHAWRVVERRAPERITVRRPPLPDRVTVVTGWMGQPEPWHALAGMRGRELVKIEEAGQYRTMLVAKGEAFLTSGVAGFEVWDTAAADAILRAAGGTMIDPKGNALQYDRGLTHAAYRAGGVEVLREFGLLR